MTDLELENVRLRAVLQQIADLKDVHGYDNGAQEIAAEALKQGATADGWQLVPIEATEQMVRATSDGGFYSIAIAIRWREMIEAAPRYRINVMERR